MTKLSIVRSQYLLLLAISVVACSSDKSTDRPNGSAAASGGTTGGSVSLSGGKGGNGFSNPDTIPMSVAGNSSLGDDDASAPIGCAKAEYEAALRPLDMLVLLDQSGSMTEHDDRWTPTTNAIKSFVNAPESAGIGIGLQYFPLGKDDDEKCLAKTYADPGVPLAPLPGNAKPMTDSIDAHYFTKDNCCDAEEHKGTPTRPPSFTCLTSAPTAAAWPTPSWPGMNRSGALTGQSPPAACRSV